MSNAGSFVCNICERACESLKALKLHASKVHEQLPNCCARCQKVFKSESALRFHKAIAHAPVGDENSSDKAKRGVGMKCGRCYQRFEKMPHLCEHLQSAHGLSTRVENLTFWSRDTFESWRMNIEKMGKFSFKKVRINQCKKSLTYTLLCHRSGALTKGRPRPKNSATDKLRFCCSAFAFVKEWTQNGQIDVQCCLEHYGHDAGVNKNRRMPEMIRRIINQHLDEGRSVKWIRETLKSRHEYLIGNAVYDISRSRKLRLTKERTKATDQIYEAYDDLGRMLVSDEIRKDFSSKLDTVQEFVQKLQESMKLLGSINREDSAETMCVE